MSLREDFGRAVRQLRKQRGWSIEVLAANAKINDKYLGAVERGQQAASLDTVERSLPVFESASTSCFVDRAVGAKELKARASALVKEANTDALRRIIAVLEVMLH